MNRALNTLNTNTAQMKRSLTGLQNDFKAVSTGVKALGATLAAVGIGAFAAEVIRSADAFNQLQAKVKNSLDSADQLDGVFKKLTASSNRTGTSIDAVAQAFVRLRPVANDLGVTNDQLIQFNETFAKMGTLAGATAEEIKLTMIQLSQGIASNRLGGDELRSVMEQMPSIARTIADSMGIPLSKLKDVAKEGKITADVVLNAVLAKTKEVDQQFSQLPLSVDRSVTRLGNSLQKFIGDLNKATGATDLVAKALDGLAGFVDQNSEAFSLLAAQIIRTTVETLKANPAFWGLGDAIERLTTINAAQWMIEFASGLDVITTKAQVAANEVGRFMATLGNTVIAGGNTSIFAGLDASTQKTFDLKNRALDAQFARREKDRVQAMVRALGPGAALRDTAGAAGRIRGLPGGDGKKKKQKADPDIADSKQLIESLKSVWDKERDAIADAQRFLSKHLITLEQYNDALRKAKRDAHEAFKIEGLTEALETFQKPMKEFADNFKTDLGDALSDPAFQQQLDIQQFTDDLVRQTEETKRLSAAKMQGAEAYELMVRQIQAENDVRSLGIDLMSEEGQLLAGLSFDTLTLQDNFQKLQERMQNFGQIGQQVAGIISNGLEGMIFRGEKFSEVLKNMALNMAQLVFQEAVSKPFAKGMGSLFSSIGGSLLKALPGFADGGMIPAMQPAIVGERGPELFLPGRTGSIVPNHQLGGGVTLNQYFTIQTIDNRDFEDRLAEHAKFIGNVSVQAVQKQSNRMGQRGPMERARG
jgi:tape measure domain-containing protein